METRRNNSADKFDHEKHFRQVIGGNQLEGLGDCSFRSLAWVRTRHVSILVPASARCEAGKTNATSSRLVAQAYSFVS